MLCLRRSDVIHESCTTLTHRLRRTLNALNLVVQRFKFLQDFKLFTLQGVETGIEVSYFTRHRLQLPTRTC